MQATGAIGEQEFLLVVGLAFDGRDQVFPGVPDPDLIAAVCLCNQTTNKREISTDRYGVGRIPNNYVTCIVKLIADGIVAADFKSTVPASVR